MLWTVAVILLILWLLGGFAFHIGGGLIHILLVVALIVIVVNLLQGRRAILAFPLAVEAERWPIQAVGCARQPEYTVRLRDSPASRHPGGV